MTDVSSLLGAMHFSAIGVELAITALLALVLVLDLLMRQGGGRTLLRYVMELGLIAILVRAVWTFPLRGRPTTFLDGLYLVDASSIFFKVLFIIGILATVIYSGSYVKQRIRHVGEFYALLLSALLGMCILASANDLITAFVGLELMTISFYILVAIRTESPTSTEAGVKYLIYGSGATATLIYGMSLLYGMTGSLVFTEMAHSEGLFLALGLIGMVMVLAGFFFKLSILPFHLWAPDVYEGAPAPVTALLAMCSKAAGIAILLRVLVFALPLLVPYWTQLLAAFAGISMVGGNLMAFRQKNIKRMLAYSSIAQAGYMMTGLSAADPAGLKSVIFYVAIYLFANIAAFVTISYLEAQRGEADLVTVRGLARHSLLPAGFLMVALLTMAGIPPTAGFIGKFYIFTAAVDAGMLWLAGIGFVVSMSSVYYYLIVIREMFRDLDPGEIMDPRPLRLPMSARVVGLVAVLFVLIIGIWAQPLSVISNVTVFLSL